MDIQNSGKVIFIGAGPGDPELLTLKAAGYLKKADVVLTDRLVSQEILDTHVNKRSFIIHVGKQCRRGISTPQPTINELIIKYGLAGNLVVRLKGGDVSVFSNIMDELETVVNNKIPYEIIPGVTAGLGAAAYAGIPLTARGYATAVRFLTYYKTDIVSDEYWQELALTDDTLVFYMSAETVDLVVQRLTQNKISEDKMIAVIEQATTPFQKVMTSNIYSYSSQVTQLISPSLIIIGKVVSLHNKFAWMENSIVNNYYFKPLTSSIIPIVENKHQKYVSRA